MENRRSHILYALLCGKINAAQMYAQAHCLINSLGPNDVQAKIICEHSNENAQGN